jgi:hypothetical protein
MENGGLRIGVLDSMRLASRKAGFDGKLRMEN